MKRRYYKTKDEALEKRKHGDRIYYDAYKESYYVINTRHWFRRFLLNKHFNTHERDKR